MPEMDTAPEITGERPFRYQRVGVLADRRKADQLGSDRLDAWNTGEDADQAGRQGTGENLDHAALVDDKMRAAFVQAEPPGVLHPAGKAEQREQAGHGNGDPGAGQTRAGRTPN